MTESKNGNSYARTNFISRAAPMEAIGFLEDDPPIIMAIAGIIRRYNITMRSPTKLSEYAIILLPKIVATRITLKSPKKGENKKVSLAPAGTIVSLPSNFTMSTKF